MMDQLVEQIENIVVPVFNQAPSQAYASSRVFSYFPDSARRDEEGVAIATPTKSQRSGAGK